VQRRGAGWRLAGTAGVRGREIGMDGHDVLRAFAGSIAEGPARVALDAGARRISYRELDDWTSELARALRPAGAGAVVAVCAGDALEWAAALIGVLKAGCVFAPLDLAQPPARLGAVVAQLAPRWFVGAAGAGAALAASGWAGAMRWCRLDAARLAAWEEAPAAVAPAPSLADPAAAPVPVAAPPRMAADPPAGQPGAAPGEVGGLAGGRGDAGGLAGGRGDAGGLAGGPAEGGFGGPCYVFQTSGSTGVPKLIAGRYEAIGHFVRWETALLGLGPGVRVSQLTAPHFDAYLRDIFTPLACGGTVCIPPAAEMRLDAGALAEWLDSREIEVLHCVPSLFHLLASADLQPGTFARLRHVLLAGEPPLAADLARWFGVFGRRVRVLNLYGPSETTMTKLFHEVRPEDLERRSIPIGRPMDGAAVLLANRHGRPCAPGTVGEILLRTPYGALGYFAQPKLTAAAFVQNPWSDDPTDRVYRTGDLGRLLPDGAVELLGRRDQQVKIRGQRVETAEIEGALGEHPQVTAAAVVARHDGAGLAALCAFVVTADDVAPRELRDWLLARLPAALVPERFVRLPELPLLRNGKVDRRGLAAADLAHAPGAPRLPPQTPTQERLAEIWEAVIESRGAGIHDDFFAVGGHSLLATRLLLRVRQAFGVEVPLAAFFDRPTLEGLAEEIEDRLLAQADPVRLAELLREIDAEGGTAPAVGDAHTAHTAHTAGGAGGGESAG
jgi:amino acid adenylation domain-containing protein